MSWISAAPQNNIGISQSFTDVTGSRTYNTAYQNTTKAPIEVIMRLSAGSIRFAEISIDNLNWVEVGNSTGANGRCSFIVPVGHFYRISGITTINSWVELR